MPPPPPGRAPERASPGWGPGSLPQHTCRTPASRLRCPWLPPKRHAILHPFLQPSPGPTTRPQGYMEQREPKVGAHHARLPKAEFLSGPHALSTPHWGPGTHSICLASLKRPTGYLSCLCLQCALGHTHFSATSGSPPSSSCSGGAIRRHSHSLPSTGESLRRVFIRHCL